MYNDEHLKETLMESTDIFKGNILDVKHEKVILPDSNTTYREVAYHKGAVGLIVVAEGYMYFVRQYRFATREVLLEIPAGKIEEGEAPSVTAKKELKEEIGARSENIVPVYEFYAAPGFSNEYIRLFEARDVEFTDQLLEDDEFLDVVKLPLSELKQRLAEGAVKDSKTLIAVQHVLANF